jgi:phosphoribosylformylglycinamidine synthase subunit PurS|tara:strand:+ start:1291 stop:1509 length:219 start_codon:yes stop_codon:yes gene_type:complete
MMYRAYITLKPAQLDIAGIAVTGALHSLGFTNVKDARLGKILEYNADSLEEAHDIARSQTNEIMEDCKVVEE